ncbi:DUF2231 domain-containing protein [Stutzerimonas frequens]|uniref:DUF2231 domain-containing protein n=1 Tax=Stutzerimonas frequens TaxID=2968969 RepID=UPI0012E1969B|nr:DUF2231 domain-containing protein [Stutzerimonas frequens]MUT72947.1 DUF2231 domain-containing protein [Stutzerimonas frequens]
MAIERESINSNAAIGGHPLHPMMIHFPVAALIGLVPADLAFLWTLDEFWWRAGLWLSGVGAIGGWIASIAGIIDLVSVQQIRRKVTAWCHAILAVMMLSLASLNWLLRYQGLDSGDGDAMWGLYLSLLTAVLISLAAFLGGRLVYEHAVGVDLDGEQAP